MSQLMLINPRRKRRATKARKSSRRSRRRAKRTMTLNVNPRRKRRTSRRRASFRRNPISSRRRGLGGVIGSGYGNFMKDMYPAAIGASGALAVDMALGVLEPMLPTELTSGVLGSVTRLAGAVGVGMIASKVAGKAFGAQVLTGSLIVTFYDLLKTLISTGSLNGYDMGWVSPAMNVNGAQMYPMQGIPYSSNVGEVGYEAEYVDGLGQYISEYV